MLARGSKRPKSSFGGPLDLFYLGTAEIYRRPRSDLHILSAFETEHSFSGLKEELPRFYAANHLVEIVLGFTREEEAHPELFRAVLTALRELEDAKDHQVPSLLAAAEIQSLGRLGFAPSLHDCSVCGKKVEVRGARLSEKTGGLVCSGCRERAPEATAASPGALKALKALSENPISAARRLRLSASDRRAIRAFLDAFVEWRLERPLRTTRFL